MAKQNKKQPLPEGYEPEDFYAPPPVPAQMPYAPQPIPVSYPKAPYVTPYRQSLANVMMTGDAAVAEVSYSLPPSSSAGPFARTFTGKGTSKRERGDSHDPVTGEVLAMARAYEELAARLHREARKRVKAQDAERRQQEIRKAKQRQQREAERAAELDQLDVEKAEEGQVTRVRLEEALKKHEPIRYEDAGRNFTYASIEALLSNGGQLRLSGGRYLTVELGFVVLRCTDDEMVYERLVKV